MTRAALPGDLDGQSSGKFLDHIVESLYRRVVVTNENPKSKGRRNSGDAKAQGDTKPQQCHESQSWSAESNIREVMHWGSVLEEFPDLGFGLKRDPVFSEHSVNGSPAAIEAPGCKRDVPTGLRKGSSQIGQLIFPTQFAVASDAFGIFLDYSCEGVPLYLPFSGKVSRALDQLL
jgi:hypothetical protein